MKNSFDFKKLIPSLIAVVIFLGITFIYFSPVLSGKTITMGDVQSVGGAGKEISDYYKSTGEWTWWTNQMFGGMPGFFISGGYPYSLTSEGGKFITNILPTPVNVIFLLMVGFYIFMLSLKKKNAIAIIASIAYAFGTYNLLYTEAGHLSKILTLAYVPGIFSGIIYLFEKKYLRGTTYLSLFLGLSIYAAHYQIIYYFIFIPLTFGLIYFFNDLKKSNYIHLLKITFSIILGVSLGLGMNASRLWSSITYSAESIRGKSELASSTAGNSGLDKDYAFSWSYGLNEMFTLIIPNIAGGASSGPLTNTSETYKSLVSGGVDGNMAIQFIQNLPLYFGDQPFTSGPAYSGIIIFFLFILGFFITKGKEKWIILALTILYIFISLGKNFETFNYFLFDYLPGYNKFRAVTMALTLVHFCLIWGAANTLENLSNLNVEIKKYTLYSLIIIVSIITLGYLSASFVGPNDNSFKQSLSQTLGGDFANRVLFSLQEDRSTIALSDIFRGLILVILTSGIVLLLTKNKIKYKIAIISISVLIAFDLIGIDKRYFNNDDFVRKNNNEQIFEPTVADLEILKDKDPNFRVLNLTANFWNDARDSYFHKSIGGYSGAKLKKTQEIFEYQMVKDGRLNMPILNMLNTKYLIVNGKDNQLVAQKNKEALGNAWFVDSLITVENANDELNSLSIFNPTNTAFTQKKYSKTTQIFKKNPSNTVSIVKYKPNEISYEYFANTDQFIVFSEIFYRGNEDWISYLDGKKVDHIKVNYLLRGMKVPVGKHEIKFEFKPKSIEVGTQIDKISSGVFILLILSGVIIQFKPKKD